MGIGLSHPVSSKILYRAGNKQFRVGAATMHGWRETMEDAHSIILSMEKHPSSAFFGIFDGHSGSACSKFVAEHLPRNIDNLTGFPDSDVSTTVMDTDQQFLDSETYKNKDDGSAGIFTIASYDATTNKYTLINANIGDSRTVLAQKDQTDDGYTAIACTYDHKPTNEEERKRIEEAGGSVQIGRVDGQLALSRAFGDRMLKTLHLPPEKRKVTSKPEIITKEACSDDFLFLACDGIYESDVFSRETVIKFISDQLKQTDDIAKICAEVLEECLKRGSRDNMSAMIVQFVDGTAYEKEKEYVPGPYFTQDNDSKFQEAYQKDALESGYTLEQALKKLSDSQNGTKQQEDNSNNN